MVNGIHQVVRTWRISGRQDRSMSRPIRAKAVQAEPKERNTRRSIAKNETRNRRRTKYFLAVHIGYAIQRQKTPVKLRT